MSVALAGNLDCLRPPAVDRRFAGILLASLALHAALALVLRQPENPPPPPLLATIRLVAATTPAAKAAPTPSAEPAAARALRPAAAVPPKARQSVTRAEPPPAPRADTAAEPAIAAARSPVAESAPAAETVAAAKPAPTAAAAVDASAEALSAYRRQLTDLFARPHEYPRIAALRGWEGEVRLRLKVARKGNLLGVQLDRSSGYEVLDRDALAMLESYGQLPPLPEALDSNEISVVVPISYKLKKTT